MFRGTFQSMFFSALQLTSYSLPYCSLLSAHQEWQVKCCDPRGKLAPRFFHNIWLFIGPKASRVVYDKNGFFLYTVALILIRYYCTLFTTSRPFGKAEFRINSPKKNIREFNARKEIIALVLRWINSYLQVRQAIRISKWKGDERVRL